MSEATQLKSIELLKQFTPTLVAFQGTVDALEAAERDLKNADFLRGLLQAQDNIQSNTMPGDVVGDYLMAQQDKISRLAHKQKQLLRRLIYTERALQSLSSDERQVLELFYIHRQSHRVQKLQLELRRSKASIYRLKATALSRFATACYGV